MGEEHPAEQPVVGDAKAPLHLAVEPCGPAEAPLDEAAPAPVACVPADRRQRQIRQLVRHHSLADEPEGEHVARHRVREPKVVPELRVQERAVLVLPNQVGFHWYERFAYRPR